MLKLFIQINNLYVLAMGTQKGGITMSYAIMRLKKIKAENIGGTDKHNERKNENYSNPDINKSLSHENIRLIECDSYKKAINKQIKERYTSSRSIRKDAVLGVEVVFTSDKEFFDKLSPEKEREFFDKSLQFLKDFAGEKNVVSAIIHKDEKTPHLHCVFTPITNDGRLHFKSFINGKFELSKFQDKYYNYISKDFDLKRGESVEQTKRKHLSVAEYKLETAINERELELKKVTKNTEEIKSKNSDLESQKEQLQKEQDSTNNALKDLEEFSKSLEKKKKEKEKEEKLNQQLKEKLTKENEILYSVKSMEENVEIKKNIITGKTKVTMEDDVYKSFLKYAREGEFYLDRYNTLKSEKEKVEEELEKSKNSCTEYSIENITLKEVKEKFEDYTKRLEEVVPKELAKIIQDENKSCMKIKSLNTNYDVQEYLKELSQKGGYNNLNKVDKEFVYEHHFSNEKAREILLTGAKKNYEEKITEKTESEWDKKLEKDNGFGWGD